MSNNIENNEDTSFKQYQPSDRSTKFYFHFPYAKKTKQQLEQFLDHNGLLYAFQHERGADTGYEHWQCYVVLKSRTRLRTFRDKLLDWVGGRDGGFYCNIWSTTNEDGVKYANKVPTRVGETTVGGNLDLIQTRQGTRSDLRAAARMILDGKYDDVIEQSPELLLYYPTGMRNAHATYLNKRFGKTQHKHVKMVRIMFTGDSGTGKTYLAHQICTYLEELYGWRTYQPQPTHNNNMYFDGYTDQEILLIDEYHNNFPITNFKQMFDNHHIMVARRGAECMSFWKVVIITSNNDFPSQFYPNKQLGNPRETQAIRRRFYHRRFSNYGGDPLPLEQLNLPSPRNVLDAACLRFGWRYEECFPEREPQPVIEETDDETEWEEEVLSDQPGTLFTPTQQY